MAGAGLPCLVIDLCVTVVGWMVQCHLSLPKHPRGEACVHVQCADNEKLQKVRTLFEEKFECGKVCGFVSTVRGGSCWSFNAWICSSEPRLLNIYQALFHSNALKS